MALFTHEDFDPTRAPAWDRVKEDDKQRIVHSWAALEDMRDSR
jgi:hypothetical protein